MIFLMSTAWSKSSVPLFSLGYALKYVSHSKETIEQLTYFQRGICVCNPRREENRMKGKKGHERRRATRATLVAQLAC